MLKQVKWSSILLSVSYIVAGVLLIMFPSASGTVIAWILGIAAIVYGVIDLTTYFLLDVRESLNRNEFAVGVLCIIFGIILIVKKDIIVEFIPIIMGMIILASGFGMMQKAIVAKRIGYDRSGIYMILAIISIILGIAVMFFMNGQTARNVIFIVAGIGLMYCGASDLIATLFLAGKFNKFVKAFENAAQAVSGKQPQTVDANVVDVKPAEESNDTEDGSTDTSNQ
jgi:uncharacterized membrane protein HdeD (DUF308 family)